MSKYGWTDTRNCVPLVDGDYIIQTVFGSITTMMYTFKGGWNTYYDTDGVLHGEDPIDDRYIARWYFPEKPPAVPKLWEKEYLERN